MPPLPPVNFSFDRKQIPNLLTYARVGAVPFCLLIILFGPPVPKLLFWIFIAAAITDYLDGFLARRWDAVSPIGTLLDPIADKLLVALMLLYLHHLGLIALIPVVVIIAREILITWLRYYLSKKGASLPVSKNGKAKTALQLLGITCLLSNPAYQLVYIGYSGIFLVWFAAGLAVISAVEYVHASLPLLRKA
jgi:CDP-diacylglycerol--glycerol-3-phosphate 3-phosphatidyltransferase